MKNATKKKKKKIKKEINAILFSKILSYMRK